jgi:hypothetical protein
MNNHPLVLRLGYSAQQATIKKLGLKNFEQSLPLHLMQNFLILENSPKPSVNIKNSEIS